MKRLTTFQIEAYAQRLKLKIESPTFKFLKNIIAHHRQQICIENLDIYFGKKILLDSQRIFEKLVEKKRGGMAFELNSLLHNLLDSLGFEIKILEARLPVDLPRWGSSFGHMVIQVKIDEINYLVDVGLKETHTIPLEMSAEKIQLDQFMYFKISQNEDGMLDVKRSTDMVHYKTLYTVNPATKTLIEFVPKLDQYQEKSDSPLKQFPFLFKKTHMGGCIYLTDKSFEHTNGVDKSIKIIDDPAQFDALTLQHFEISVRDLFEQGS